jgi:lysophospholipid acyltransferase (LPLAT)-like uncharacterized protein
MSTRAAALRAEAAPGGRLLGSLVALAYRTYYRTVRLRGCSPSGEEFDPRGFPLAGEIWALCECDALALAGLAANRSVTALVTVGRDGDWAAAALAKLGCTIVRGSSRRGGWEALRGILRRLGSSPASLAMVVDGPLGPAGRARPGAVVCARESGRPLVPVAAAAGRRLRFPRTWSGIYLPLPWSRVWIALGDPVAVPAATADADLASLTAELEGRLRAARQRANAAAGRGEEAT